MTDYITAHQENRQAALAVFTPALEVIKKTSPHFVPAGYKCVWIADGRPTNRWFAWNSSPRRAGISEEKTNLAQDYRDDHVKFCLKNHLGEAQRDDVMIVIAGYTPACESVTPDCDEDTSKSVHENDTRPVILNAHYFFLSALEQSALK